VEPDGRYSAAGVIISQSGDPMPFTGTVTVIPRSRSWWARLLAWLRSFPA